ncbi:MAG TPA: 16S rRNA (uracil(1498)-N(3))-methyltransferase [Burkholderiales bacterium]|nr:16S rRNA (uracil(1498)-N(3))-methyltransferase [Burkholderiales bacterium]
MKTSAIRPVPRFFAPIKLSPGVEIKLPERAARHCAVLRLRCGDAVTVFNGEGGEFAAELTRVSRDDARAGVISRRTVERESPLAIALAQCVSSRDRMDVTLQKSTELGVSRIVPIASERSVVKLSSDRADRRVAHWRNIVVAACEQCGRNRVPEIAAIVDFATFLGGVRSEGTRLLLAPDADLDLRHMEPPRAVTLLVGPEGGLAPEERQGAETSGFVPVRFGPRVLRTETAPLAAIAAMQALWGDC